MADRPLRDVVVPVLANSNQTVEIHWRLKDGRVVIVACVSPEP